MGVIARDKYPYLSVLDVSKSHLAIVSACGDLELIISHQLSRRAWEWAVALFSRLPSCLLLLCHSFFIVLIESTSQMITFLGFFHLALISLCLA